MVSQKVTDCPENFAIMISFTKSLKVSPE